MCISVGHSYMNHTSIYAGEAIKNDKYVHVLAYQNHAESSGPNAMVLPIPTEVSLNSDNVIDTTKNKSFLKNISKATKKSNPTKGLRGGSRGQPDSFGEAQVFDVGSYTVILADNVNQIPTALSLVDINKRPKVTDEFLEGFGKLYPKQPIAVCCWNDDVGDKSEPLLWWYEPKDKNTLFIPTMDAHDGKFPRLDAEVETNHVVSIGSAISNKYDIPDLANKFLSRNNEIKATGNRVYYTETLTDELKELLPTFVHGTKLPYEMINGDCEVKIDQINESAPLIKRGYNNKYSYTGTMIGWSE